MREALRAFVHPRVLTMLFLGFSAGIPILLIFSSLSLWLREAGVDRAAVTFFSWAALSYSFKFLWAPLVDRLPVPLLSKWLGRRRGWLLLSQLCVVAAICWMSATDPAQGLHSLILIALAAMFLGFSSATQDIVIDAYRIESAGQELQAVMASSYMAGYRLGMIVAGAGPLLLASYFGADPEVYNYAAWRSTYLVMACTMLVGLVTTLVIDEPSHETRQQDQHSVSDYLRFLLLFLAAVAVFISVFFVTSGIGAELKAGFSDGLVSGYLAGFLVEALRFGLALVAAALIGGFVIRRGWVNREMARDSYVSPVEDFFVRYGFRTSVLLLGLIGFYRVSDIVLGVIANLFYQDLGFSKLEIAGVVKTFGTCMTIAGGFLGGFLSLRFGVMRILFLGALLTVLTNLLFMYQAHAGHDLTVLYFVVSADNLSAGIASAAFVAFMSSLTNVSFTATQYALFSSLMTLFPKLMGGYSGTIVEAVSYSNFFLVASLMGVPVLLLVSMAAKRLSFSSH